MAEAVWDNRGAQRFEIARDGEVQGFIDYEQRSNAVALVHTEVSADERGSGVGQRLVLGALSQIQAQGTHVIPECPYVDHVMQEHPEYADLLA